MMVELRNQAVQTCNTCVRSSLFALNDETEKGGVLLFLLVAILPTNLIKLVRVMTTSSEFHPVFLLCLISSRYG
eukprot:scaffold32535_cov44-Attheya_sp.AAC.2